MNYISNGITTPDCTFDITGSEGAAVPRMTDCANNVVDISGGSAFLNSSLGCSCELQDPVPVLEVTPPTLTFAVGDNEETLSIRNIGPGELQWDAVVIADWISVTPPSGSGDADVVVSIDRSQLLGPSITTVTVVSNGGFASIQVSVEFSNNPPILGVTPTELIFQPAENQHAVNVMNQGDGNLNWSLEFFEPWLDATPVSGVNDGEVTVTVDRTGYADGTYQGVLRVNSDAGFRDVLVDMIVLSTPVLQVNPTFLNFPSGIDQLVLTITNAGVGSLDWSIVVDQPWLSLSSAAGSTPGGLSQNVVVTVDRTGLGNGNYYGVISVTSNGGNEVVPAVMTVELPVLDVTPLALNYPYGVNNRNVTVTNAGLGTLNWAATPSHAWIAVHPPAGSLPAGADDIVLIGVDRSGLSEGTHEGSVEFTSNGGTETVELSVDVVLEPVLEVSPPSLYYHPEDVDLMVNLANTGTADLNWSATPSEPWVQVTPAGGTQPPGSSIPLNVGVIRAGLAHGTHTASIDFTSDGGNATVNLTVEVVTEPILDVVPTGISFNQIQPSKAFAISNVGVGTLQWDLSWTESWISVDQQSGTGDATIIVTIDVPNAPNQNTDAVISVSSNGGDQDVGIFWRPSVSGGVGGSIGVYADPIGLNPCVEDITGIVTLHVVHTNTVGAKASQFSAPIPICWTGAVWLSDTPNYDIWVGNSQNGIAIAYGGCVPTPNHILTISVLALGLTSVDCCAYTVLPDPNAASGQIDVVNCADELVFGNGFTSFVSVPPCNCAPSVRTEHTTWGAIKSIYSETPAQAAGRKGTQP